LRTALLGAFLLGAAFGVFQTEHPWRGTSIIANAGLVLEYSLGLALFMAIIWSLTAARLWAVMLIRRKRA